MWTTNFYPNTKIENNQILEDNWVHQKPLLSEAPEETTPQQAAPIGSNKKLQPFKNKEKTRASM